MVLTGMCLVGKNVLAAIVLQGRPLLAVFMPKNEKPRLKTGVPGF
jgi:hypothetical protein